MKKVLIVLGTRPEAIKFAPVINLLKSKGAPLITEVCVTAQHREMLDQVLALFSIKPDFDLNIMKKDQSLFNITTDILNKLQDVFTQSKPSLALVQGDTTTAFIAGLVAFYLKIPIGHIEAGLRTFDKHNPYPEEMNRHLLSVLADYHFAPTERNRTNLIREGVTSERIWVTGNTVVDALLDVVKQQDSEKIQREFEEYFYHKWHISLPGQKSLKSQDPSARLILVTGHRRESFGEKFMNICLAIKDIAETRSDVVIVYPVHLNPNVQVPVKSILGGVKNIFLIEPIEYEHFVFLMKRAFLILTDSGGIQEEAPSLGKPILLMRETTERPEGVEAGVVKISGTDRMTIVRDAMSLLNNKKTYLQMSNLANPFGDGKASERIVGIVEALMSNKLGFPGV